MWNLEKMIQMNLFTKQKETSLTDIENKQLPKAEGVGEGWIRRLGLRYTRRSYCRVHAAAAAKSLQSCLTLCDPMDCSPPGSSIHGIFQARVLEWGAIAFS